MRLQEGPVSVSKVIPYPASVATHTDVEGSNYGQDCCFRGQLLKDAQYAWLSNGPHLEVLHALDGAKVAAWTFGTVMLDPSTCVTCVIELPSTDGSGHVHQLLVGLSSELTGGMICVFDIRGSKVLRAVHIPDKVVSLSLIDAGCDSRYPLPMLLGAMSGVVAVGTGGGRVLLVDLCRTQEEVCDEVQPCQLALLSPSQQPEELEKRRVLAARVGDHLCVVLNEVSLSNKVFYLETPTGDLQCKILRDKVEVTSLLYVPRIASVVVGFNFGCFQIWNLMTMSLQYSSPLMENPMAVTHLAFQEPCEDPRNFCYLWVVHGVTPSDRDAGYTRPACVMYSLCYQSKEWLDGYGYLYEDLMTCTMLFENDLCAEESSAVGGRCISCHSIGKAVASRRNLQGDTDESLLENDVSLCMFVWEAVGPDLTGTVRMRLFDLNQWYKDQMPRKIVGRSSYMVTFPLEGAVRATDGPLLDARVDPGSMSQFSSVHSLEEHFYPSALAFESHCMFARHFVVMNHPGAQRDLLCMMETSGPSCLMQPSKLYYQCLAVGLRPSCCEVNSSLSSVVEQRHFLLSVALENQLLPLVMQCAAEWAGGSHESLGLTVDWLLQWGWARAVFFKEQADSLCVSLFDCSGLKLDNNSAELLDHCGNQLNHLATLFSGVLKMCKNSSSSVVSARQDLEQKAQVLAQVAVYIQVVQWFANVGLLPEHQYNDLDEVSENGRVPYPVATLSNTYERRRAELQAAGGSADLLFVDGLVSGQVSAHWAREGGSGKYPPPSLQSLLSCYLLSGVPLPVKHSLVIYVLLDLAAVLDTVRYRGVIDSFVKFPSAFRLSPSVIKITQALWQLDHRDFEEALDMLLDPLVSADNLHPLQHRNIVRALMVQGEHQKALRYLRVQQPPLREADDIKLYLTLLLINGLVHEAFQFQRLHSNQYNCHDLLQHFFAGCHESNQLPAVLRLALSPAEEEAFTSFLASCRSPHANDMRIMYFLERSRVVEAMDVNDNIRLRKLKSSPRKRIWNNGQPVCLRDLVCEAYSNTLPPMTRQLATYCSRLAESCGTWKQADRPSPLSVSIHPSSARQPRYRSALIRTVLNKTCETWSQPPAADCLPFLCTPRAGGAYPCLSATPLIYPTVLCSAEDSGPSPSKRVCYETDVPVSNSKDDAAALLHTPHVRRRKPVGHSRLPSDTDLRNGRDVFTPQSILKVRRLVQTGSPARASVSPVPSTAENSVATESSEEAEEEEAEPVVPVPRQIRFSLPSREYAASGTSSIPVLRQRKSVVGGSPRRGLPGRNLERFEHTAGAHTQKKVKVDSVKTSKQSTVSLEESNAGHSGKDSTEGSDAFLSLDSSSHSTRYNSPSWGSDSESKGRSEKRAVIGDGVDTPTFVNQEGSSIELAVKSEMNKTNVIRKKELDTAKDITHQLELGSVSSLTVSSNDRITQHGHVTGGNESDINDSANQEEDDVTNQEEEDVGNEAEICAEMGLEVGDRKECWLEEKTELQNETEVEDFGGHVNNSIVELEAEEHLLEDEVIVERRVLDAVNETGKRVSKVAPEHQAFDGEAVQLSDDEVCVQVSDDTIHGQGLGSESEQLLENEEQECSSQGDQAEGLSQVQELEIANVCSLEDVEGKSISEDVGVEEIETSEDEPKDSDELEATEVVDVPDISEGDDEFFEKDANYSPVDVHCKENATVEDRAKQRAREMHSDAETSSEDKVGGLREDGHDFDNEDSDEEEEEDDEEEEEDDYDEEDDDDDDDDDVDDVEEEEEEEDDAEEEETSDVEEDFDEVGEGVIVERNSALVLNCAHRSAEADGEGESDDSIVVLDSDSDGDYESGQLPAEVVSRDPLAADASNSTHLAAFLRRHIEDHMSSPNSNRGVIGINVLPASANQQNHPLQVAKKFQKTSACGKEEPSERCTPPENEDLTAEDLMELSVPADSVNSVHEPSAGIAVEGAASLCENGQAVTGDVSRHLDAELRKDIAANSSRCSDDELQAVADIATNTANELVGNVPTAAANEQSVKVPAEEVILVTDPEQAEESDSTTEVVLSATGDGRANISTVTLSSEGDSISLSVSEVHVEAASSTAKDEDVASSEFDCVENVLEKSVEYVSSNKELGQKSVAVVTSSPSGECDSVSDIQPLTSSDAAHGGEQGESISVDSTAGRHEEADTCVHVSSPAQGEDTSADDDSPPDDLQAVNTSYVPAGTKEEESQVEVCDEETPQQPQISTAKTASDLEQTFSSSEPKENAQIDTNSTFTVLERSNLDDGRSNHSDSTVIYEQPEELDSSEEYADICETCHGPKSLHSVDGEMAVNSLKDFVPSTRSDLSSNSVQEDIQSPDASAGGFIGSGDTESTATKDSSRPTNKCETNDKSEISSSVSDNADTLVIDEYANATVQSTSHEIGELQGESRNFIKSDEMLKSDGVDVEEVKSEVEDSSPASRTRSKSTKSAVEETSLEGKPDRNVRRGRSRSSTRSVSSRNSAVEVQESVTLVASEEKQALNATQPFGKRKRTASTSSNVSSMGEDRMSLDENFIRQKRKSASAASAAIGELFHTSRRSEVEKPRGRRKSVDPEGLDEGMAVRTRQADVVRRQSNSPEAPKEQAVADNQQGSVEEYATARRLTRHQRQLLERSMESSSVTAKQQAERLRKLRASQSAEDVDETDSEDDTASEVSSVQSSGGRYFLRHQSSSASTSGKAVPARKTRSYVSKSEKTKSIASNQSDASSVSSVNEDVGTRPRDRRRSFQQAQRALSTSRVVAEPRLEAIPEQETDRLSGEGSEGSRASRGRGRLSILKQQLHMDVRRSPRLGRDSKNWEGKEGRQKGEEEKQEEQEFVFSPPTTVSQLGAGAACSSSSDQEFVFSPPHAARTVSDEGTPTSQRLEEQQFITPLTDEERALLVRRQSRRSRVSSKPNKTVSAFKRRTVFKLRPRKKT